MLNLVGLPPRCERTGCGREGALRTGRGGSCGASAIREGSIHEGPVNVKSYVRGGGSIIMWGVMIPRGTQEFDQDGGYPQPQIRQVCGYVCNGADWPGRLPWRCFNTLGAGRPLNGSE